MSVAEQQSLPARIGRYEVLARLATGGMAEILLGRVHGPSGFERAVVIKRILPHCASLPTFVEMFLDEARIAARIHHPNVVQVQELGEDGSELFLVMEYLQGESTASIMRRMTARGRLPTPAVCAHVVAEACAGLHAAHELRDGSGRSVGLVHRDISPQNIFVTYDGAVKLLDFGIAKAADRISHTEAGTLKGKFDYMSPEQAEGLPLDRRSDLFSLGIVLYEMSTGRRLFKRGRQVESLRAVREDVIVPPSRLVPGYPPELEAVVLRALTRDPDRRFQTAEEMRRELGRVVRTLSTDALPEEELVDTMRSLFGERMDEKRSMMEMVRAGTGLSMVPTAEVDLAVDIPEVRGDTVLQDQPPTTASDTQGSRSSRWVWLAAALVPLALVGSWVVARGGEPPETAVAPLDERPPSAQADPGPSAGPGPTQPSPGQPTSQAVPGPAEIRLRVESSPPGARVLVDGEPRGETPAELSLPRGSEPVSLRLEREGHAPLERAIVPEMSQLLQLSLERDRRRPRTARRQQSQEGQEGQEGQAQGQQASEGPPAKASDYFRRFE